MKNVLIAILSLSSTAAFACPNLAGHFECKDFDTNSVQDVVLSQAGNTYTMTITADGKTVSSTYVADGVLRTVPRDDFTSRTEKSYCNGESVMKEIKGVMKTGEALDAVVTIKLTREGNMWDSYVGKQGTKDLNFSETCRRL